MLTTRVARASPSTSSAMIKRGLPALETFSSKRQKIVEIGDLLLVDQQVGVFQNSFHALLVGDEVRRQIAAVELHALDHVEAGIGTPWPLLP